MDKICGAINGIDDEGRSVGQSSGFGSLFTEKAEGRLAHRLGDREGGEIHE